MRETPEYYARTAKGQNNTNSANSLKEIRQELEAYTYDELLDVYKRDIDPDGEEDISDMSEDELRDHIVEKMNAIRGGAPGKRIRTINGHPANRNNNQGSRNSKGSRKSKGSRNSRGSRNSQKSSYKYNSDGDIIMKTYSPVKRTQRRRVVRGKKQGKTRRNNRR